MMSMLSPITKRLSNPLIKLICFSVLLTSGAAYASQQSPTKSKKTQASSSASASISNASLLRYPTAEPFQVTSQFNPSRVNPVTRKRMPHKGIDFSMPIGSTVISTGAGEVVIAKFSRSAGNYIVIRHANGYSTQYMHLSKLLVTQGQKVKQGQKIGLSGNTGRSTAAHLHYELWANNSPIDPLSSQFSGVAIVNNFNLNHPDISTPVTASVAPKASKAKSPFSASKGQAVRDIQSVSLQDANYETRILGDGKILYTKRVASNEAN